MLPNVRRVSKKWPTSAPKKNTPSLQSSVARFWSQEGADFNVKMLEESRKSTVKIKSTKEETRAIDGNQKGHPTWSDVKTKLADFDRTGLLGLVQNMYGSSKDNQTFLHARLALGAGVLKPYKVIIDRWLWPDVFKNQDTSVSKAKKAISDYKKAVGLPESVMELMVFYCERAASFSSDIGLQDENYFDALVRMFEQALKISLMLSPEQQNDFLARLIAVRDTCHHFGYGVGDDMDAMLLEYGSDD